MGLTLRETPLDPWLTQCELLGYRLFSHTKRKNTPLSLLMLSQPFCVSVCPYACFRWQVSTKQTAKTNNDGRNATGAQPPQHTPPPYRIVTTSFTTGDTNMQQWAYRLAVCDDVTAKLNGRTSAPKMDAGSSWAVGNGARRRKSRVNK